MEKFCAPYISYWKRTFLSLIAIAMLLPSQAWGASVAISVDTPQDTNTTADDYNIDTNDVTFTNNANISFAAGDTVDVVPASTGVTIINNGTISTTGIRAIDANAGSNNLTIINSGTISATGGLGIRIQTSSGLSFTNNAGASITSVGAAAINFGGSSGTLTNSGTISSDSQTIQTGSGTGALTITNTASGVISSTGNIAVRLQENDTLINFGTISSSTSQSINLFSNNNTIILKEGSIIVGAIGVRDTATTGNKLQIDQGFGQSYFYEINITAGGAIALEDLSGNVVVAGSAGSVGLGAQESVDELLGLRAFNLRSALKRYAAAPRIFKDDKLWAEPFSWFSKRGGNSSILGYEALGYGINFIYPLKQRKLDLIFTIEKSELEIERNHDVSRTSFFAGVSAPDFASLGDFKFSGFLVAGRAWHNGDREIFTNATSTGKDDIKANFQSTEFITGGNVSHSFNRKSAGLIKNNWKTEVGFTLACSLIEDYDESQHFSWEERQLI